MITLTLNLADGRTIEVSMQRDQAEDLSEQIQDQLDDDDDDAQEPDLVRQMRPYIWAATSIMGAVAIWNASHPFHFGDFVFGLLLFIGGTVAFVRTFHKEGTE